MKETEKFNFESFIISKGFKKFSNHNYSYTVNNDFVLNLRINTDEYIIEHTPEDHIKSKIPTTEEAAKTTFDRIEKLLIIEFEKKD